MRPGFVGSYGLGPGRPAMRADTRENPVGKNGVMTVATPNLCSHAHTHVCSHTHRDNSYLETQKKIEISHTLAKWGSGSRKKKIPLS
jgi:hypothetical protein